VYTTLQVKKQMLENSPPNQYFDVALESKVRNAFSEVFLVQIRQSFEKHVFKAKKV
jgi:hypothetical protein